MGKLLVVIAIIAAVAYAWHQGWIQQWFGSAVDSGIESTRRIQRDATKVRPADPGAPEEKK
jgi:hypothetical protein